MSVSSTSAPALASSSGLGGAGSAGRANGSVMKRGGQAVSWAGFGYAAYLVAVFGARLVFIYGSDHWYARSLSTWLAAHQLSTNALSDAIIFMAIAMALARSALLALRGRNATRHAETAGGGLPANALGQNGTVR